MQRRHKQAVGRLRVRGFQYVTSLDEKLRTVLRSPFVLHWINEVFLRLTFWDLKRGLACPCGLRLLNHRFPTRIIRGRPGLFAFVTPSALPFPSLLKNVQFLRLSWTFFLENPLQHSPSNVYIKKLYICMIFHSMKKYTDRELTERWRRESSPECISPTDLWQTLESMETSRRLPHIRLALD